MGTFQLSVRPFSPGPPLPLKSVASIPAGSRLVWNPVHLAPQATKSGEVTAVVVSASGGDLITLEPKRAGARAVWQILDRPQVIALIFGPQGLSEGKIHSLMTRNRDLMRQLADYADQSSQVESLVQKLADAEQSGGSAQAVLKGFSSQYGATPQKLDTKASSNDQAALLLKALLPASSAYDPLSNRTSQVQQSGGLAASVAGMFFGTPVGLAAGGATILQNLKTALFPNTEFRSAFAQTSGRDTLALCAKDPAPKSKTRTAYLWAYRVPDLKKPAPSLAGTPHLPLGLKSAVALKVAEGSDSPDLERAREWRLAPAGGGSPIPVDVKPGAAGVLEIDLSKAKVPAGAYQLTASWDWDSLAVAGTLHLHPLGDFARASLAPGEGDKLVEGNGTVAVKLSGADFQFLEKVALESAARDAQAVEIPFELPLGKRAGPQNSVTVNIDTAKPGPRRLLLTQSGAAAQKVPVAVLPPNPKIANLPIRLNEGETRSALRLIGTGLERIEAVTSDAGAITGAPGERQWSGEIRLASGLVKGRRLPLLLKVKGLENPLALPDAIEIVGPRPKILSVRKSLAGAPGIELASDELPAGAPVGLALTVQSATDDGRPRLELDCEAGASRRALALSPGEPSPGASLTLAGPGSLYLSVDPGAVGYAGCRLTAAVIVDPEGRSDRLSLGRVVRIPRLDKFTLTSEKVGDSSYAGTLEGRDLDVIEKTGWDSGQGVPVDSIPAPLPGDHSRQTLRVVLPWPAPAPHAPLYVWLRGETQGRRTAVAY